MTGGKFRDSVETSPFIMFCDNADIMFGFRRETFLPE